MIVRASNIVRLDVSPFGSLASLYVTRCPRLTEVAGLSSCGSLREVTVKCCDLRELRGVPEGVEKVDVSYNSLGEAPELGGVEKVDLRGNRLAT